MLPASSHAMTRALTRALTGAAVLALLLTLCGACASAPRREAGAAAPCAVSSSEPAPPTGHAWLGVALQWERETAKAYADRLGHAPAALVSFVSFPMTTADLTNLRAAAEQAQALGSRLLVTLEPQSGLAVVTQAASEATARMLEEQVRRGVPVLARFAHEMNGSWYPWGQQPAAYVRAFRTFADAVHRLAPGVATMWAPNTGQGYPFAGGASSAKPGSPAAAALDTDHNGALDAGDDPYAPYWPGARYVDWVGLSAYHWGSKYPWGANVVPTPGKFAGLIDGSYRDPNTPGQQVPNFYQRYAAGEGRPLAITETGALWNPRAGGPGALAVKQAWWRQVFAPDLLTRFPRIGLIDWFEQSKLEPEISGEVDWTATVDPALRAAYRAGLPAWGAFAPGHASCAA